MHNFNHFRIAHSKKVYIYSISECYRRLLDAQKIKDYCKHNGYKITQNPNTADYIVINTCAAIQSTEDNSIKTIRTFKKYKGKLIVTGCLPKINELRLKSIFNGPSFSPTNINEIEKAIPKNNVKYDSISEPNKLYRTPYPKTNNILHFIFTTVRNILSFIGSENIFRKNSKVFYIRISSGCLGNCSYCSIKKAVGLLKSKSLELCLSEFNVGIKKGYRYFQLEAADTGAYGIDIGLDFPTLLEKILNIPEKFKIYLTEFNPRWLNMYSDKLIKLFQSNKIKKLSIPIQSGSIGILKRMQRDTNINKTKKILLQLSNKYPDLKIETHIIIGFPGETNIDLEKTLNFIKDVNFSKVSIFKFAAKNDTKAAKLIDKIPDQIINLRIKKAEIFFQKYKILYEKEVIEKETFQYKSVNKHASIKKLTVKDIFSKPRSSLVVFSLLASTKIFSFLEKHINLTKLQFKEKIFFILCNLSQDKRFVLDKLLTYFSPVKIRNSNNKTLVEIHSVVSNLSLSQYLLLADSLRYYSQVDFPFVIHDDGTLTASDIKLLKQRIPNSRIVLWKKNIFIFKTFLKKYSKLFKEITSVNSNRYEFIKSISIPFFANSNYIIHLDSNILFFKKPKELLEWALSSRHYNQILYMKDYLNSFCLSESQCEKKFNVKYLNKFNIGIFCFSKKKLFNITTLNNYFSYLISLGKQKELFSSQTFFMIQSQKKHLINKMLNIRYLKFNESGKKNNSICNLYDTGYENDMYKDSILLLLKINSS